MIALGLTSYFLPLLYFDREILGKTQWSPSDIARAVATRQLPVAGGSIDWGPGGLLDIGALYLLMLFSLVALFIPGPPTIFRIIASIGFFLSWEGKWWGSMLRQMFGYRSYLAHFGVAPWHMRRGVGGWILPFVLPALLVICFRETLDGVDNYDDTPLGDSPTVRSSL